MDLSVIIPTLNEEKCIGQCLKSIQRQKFDGTYEVIIGDGCSTDKTHKICKKYGAKIVLEPKKTISAGRQKACEAAKGRAIVSTDADIIASEGWLQTTYDTLYSSPDNGVSCTYGAIYLYDGNALDKALSRYVMPAYMRLMAMVGAPSPAGSNLAFKRDAFKKIGGFNTDMVTGEDIDLVKRLAGVGKLVYNPKSLVHVSVRRVKSWGYLKYIGYHLSNLVGLYTTGKGHSSYEPVR